MIINIKYLFLMLVIFIVNSSKTIIDSIGFSITNFNTYNPDKKIIKDFSVHNFMDYVRIYYTIFNMEGTYGERYSVNIPCDVFEEYLNGIPTR